MQTDQDRSRSVATPAGAPGDMRQVQWEPLACESSGDTSGDSDDAEDPDKHFEEKWSLSPGDSVYSESIIVPLIEPEIRRLRRRKLRCCGYSLARCPPVTPLFTLVINLVVQFVVLTKVRALTKSKLKDTSDRVFHRLCQRNDVNLVSFLGLEPRQPYWNCGPITPLLLSKTSALDLNHDGFWSQDEALQLHRTWQSEYFLKRNTLGTTWQYFKKHHAQKQQRMARHENVTSIPLQDIEGEIRTLGLCAAADPNLCGNLEARGILEEFIPASKHKQTRISECRAILDRCDQAFGQEYQVYVDWVGELCGAPEKKWVRDKRVISTLYEKPQAFEQSKDAITKPPYFCLLIVILLVWWMNTIVELRRCLLWWVVLLWFPYPGEVEGAPVVVTFEDRHPHSDLVKTVQIKAMTWRYRAMALVLNVLPRTVIAVWLSMVGSEFLLTADDYENLILNSCALAFLLEVDDMFYKAVTGEDIKGWMRSCEPLAVEGPSLGCCDHGILPLRLTLTCFIVLVTMLWVMQGYYNAEGKYQLANALRCLCQTEGQDCIVASFLGGQTSLNLSA